MEQQVAIHLELCVELQAQLEGITPDKYIKSPVIEISGVKMLGSATELMKQMYTFWRQKEELLEELRYRLKQAREQGNQNELKKIVVLFGTNELLLRGVHTALGYEVGRHFDAFGQRFGIDDQWMVYTEDLPPLSYLS